ncbi:MAG: ribulose-phosphate 3-epimerase [Clostridia bacterium]|nr:ribulose-phosphate 3-epimerase [Clostridia bacterium]
MKEIKIAPSILSANFAIIGQETADITKCGADLIHLDVMDGVFVPNMSFGYKLIKEIRPYSKAIFDTHLMITKPERYIKEFCEAGSDIVTIHYEACEEDVSKVLDQIRSYGVKSAVSIKPKTPVSVLKPLLKHLDMILLMSVEPGFGGQMFMEDAVLRLEEINKMVNESGLDIDIEVDGGITFENVNRVKQAGANVIVAGSTVFNHKDRAEAIEKLRTL